MRFSHFIYEDGIVLTSNSTMVQLVNWGQWQIASCDVTWRQIYIRGRLISSQS